MDCSREIQSILKRLDEPSRSVQVFLQREADCVNALADLPDECAPTLLAAADHYLSNAAQQDGESNFQVLLQAIANRGDPAAVTLSLDALFSESTVDKESYVSMLFGLNQAAADILVSRRLSESRPETQQQGENLAAVLDSLSAATGVRFIDAARVHSTSALPDVTAAVERFGKPERHD
jgi:hypothetical protein